LINRFRALGVAKDRIRTFSKVFLSFLFDISCEMTLSIAASDYL
jgi:hypothetical protein